MKTMKAHKVTLFIIDNDNCGAEGVRDVLENTRYPNRCISPDVDSVVSVDVGDWHDGHPLNQTATYKEELKRLFAKAVRLPSSVLNGHSHNTAAIFYRDGSGIVKDWFIGAIPDKDNEQTLREHLHKHLPNAEFVAWAIK